MSTINDKQERLNRYLHFLKQDPENLNLLLSISNSYRLLNDFCNAQSYLDRAKAIDNEAWIALQGLLYLNQGHFNEAKTMLIQALEMEDTAILRYGLAICHYSLNETEEGLAVLAPLLSIEEPGYDVDFLHAQLAYQQGNFDEAIQLLETALDKYGSDEQTLTLLAQVYLDNQEEALARITAQQALAINPQNFEAKVILLLLDVTTNTVTVNQIKKLLAQEPNDSRLWFALGTTYFHETKLHKAEKAYLKAVELDPQGYDHWVGLGWCQLFLNKLAEAQYSYQQVVTIHETGSEGWGGLALVHALSEKFTEATNLIAKAKGLDRDCFLAKIAQMIYLQHIHPEKTAHQFQKTFPTIAEQLKSAMIETMETEDNDIKLH